MSLQSFLQPMTVCYITDMKFLYAYYVHFLAYKNDIPEFW
jgi:hypothetical protein